MYPTQKWLQILLAGWIAVTMLFLILHDSAATGAGYGPAPAASERLAAASTGGWLAAALLPWGLATHPSAPVDDLLASDRDLESLYREASRLTRVAQSPPRIALGFDDYPFPDFSSRLLSVLAEQGAPATLFGIGRKLEGAPQYANLARAEGHSLQTHTYHHPRLTDLSAEQVQEDLQQARDLHEALLGEPPRFLRSPGGRSNAQVRQIARELGLLCLDPLVSDVYDIGRSAEAIAQRCSELAAPGALLVMHDGVPETVEALPQIIADLRARGYELVTVDRLLAP